MIRIANAAGFLGDWLAAPERLVSRVRVDYLTLEYLAELTLSILARAREKNPSLGYAEDFLEVLPSLVPHFSAQPRLKIVTNAGGMNPLACVQQAAKLLVAAHHDDCRIGAVWGDDLMPQLDALRQRPWPALHAETNASPPDPAKFVSANAYLGARPIAAALEQSARLVVTGRVADASLTVGPAMHEFGVSWNDWGRLASFSVAGHLIECGAQVTGGYSVDWQRSLLTDVGYPIAEIESDGSCVITKPPGSEGRVDRRTVVEQLVYEIGDPRHYLTPDVDCDFTTVDVADVGPDRVRVRVSPAQGSPAPATYKVSLAYRDGYFASGTLLVVGRDAIAKARSAAEIIAGRLKLVDAMPERWNVELLGAGDGSLLVSTSEPSDTREVVLRLTAHDPDRAKVERFTREIAPLITSGPAGLAGYAAGRPSTRPVFAYWPTSIPREWVTPRVEVRTAREWLA